MYFPLTKNTHDSTDEAQTSYGGVFATGGGTLTSNQKYKNTIGRSAADVFLCSLQTV